MMEFDTGVQDIWDRQSTVHGNLEREYWNFIFLEGIVARDFKGLH